MFGELSDMSSAHQEQIKALRAANLTPKQIARKLGMKVSEVSTILKSNAESDFAEKVVGCGGEPVFQCLVSTTAASLLADSSDNQPTSQITKSDKDDISSLDSGLLVVTIAREAKYNQIKVYTYLLDIWCLGVKDCANPRTMSRSDYNQFVDYAYKAHLEAPIEISLAQAQGMVYSAWEYGEKLGFKPHRDFNEAARSHLGTWDGSHRIECGRDGKPFYVSGPYDSPKKIMDTLKASVGEGNFDYLIGVE